MNEKIGRPIIKMDLEEFISDLKGRNEKPDQKFRSIPNSKGKKKGAATEIRSK